MEESSMPTLLSIAIPTYNRVRQLEYGLKRLLTQTSEEVQSMIEIHVADDCSTDDTPSLMANLTKDYPFIHYERYASNIGLEKNLIACTHRCKGKYLWIFGDDDFLEFDDSLSCVLSLLEDEHYPFYILNRTRRSFDLSQLLSENWMRLNPSSNMDYFRLRDFCVEWGIISIIGFISVNIFLRERFLSVDINKYLGIMYPQLGMMLEAFSNEPCKLVSRPLICHRTQTQAEKRAALGTKVKEKDFMSDHQHRDALYFSFRLVRFLNHLIDCDAFCYDELKSMHEFVFANIPLKEFLLRNIELAVRMRLGLEERDWPMVFSFFAHMNLDEFQNELLQEIYKMDINA
jgi:glycosyltransferase involved in cell wall biosynthesis